MYFIFLALGSDKETYTGISWVYKRKFSHSIPEQCVKATSLGQTDLVHLREVTSLTNECTCPVTGHAVPITGSFMIVVSCSTKFPIPQDEI